jgi:adenine-specific DNA-methyltransferase
MNLELIVLAKKGKLELTWVGKDDRVKLEPRVLVEDHAKSYGDPNTANILIYGDNLLSLKALEQDFAGRIKCIFIDPPYNTGAAFQQYDDGLEHSIWLTLVRDRIQILYRLLSSDGSLWITIDDNECHYLKVLCDEIFGRQHFIANIIWQKKYTVANDAKWFSDNHDHILVYAKNREIWHPNKLSRPKTMNKRYKNPDNHPKGPWKATPLHAKSGSASGQNFSYTFNNGVTWSPPPGTYPRFSPENLKRMDDNNEIWFGKNGTATPSRKTFLCELTSEGITPLTIWLHNEVGHNHEARDEVKAFNPQDPFATPKPEKLLHRIIHLSTSENDIILDSFAGSGTTGAVAHKMGRKWIMCELGEQCHTHIIPRMKAVVDGSDQGGISKVVNWQGGGGFKYCRLAESLLVTDKELSTKNNPVYIINPRYDEKMLIQAICKIENFRYRNDGRLHGISSESRVLHVTTNLLTQVYLDSLAEDIGHDQSLLIYCTRRKRGLSVPDNIEIKKIPRDLLSKCDFQEDK